jgi:hypothetical protein
LKMDILNIINYHINMPTISLAKKFQLLLCAPYTKTTTKRITMTLDFSSHLTKWESEVCDPRNFDPNPSSSQRNVFDEIRKGEHVPIKLNRLHNPTIKCAQCALLLRLNHIVRQINTKYKRPHIRKIKTNYI